MRNWHDTGVIKEERYEDRIQLAKSHWEGSSGSEERGVRRLSCDGENAMIADCAKNIHARKLCRQDSFQRWCERSCSVRRQAARVNSRRPAATAFQRAFAELQRIPRGRHAHTRNRAVSRSPRRTSRCGACATTRVHCVPCHRSFAKTKAGRLSLGLRARNIVARSAPLTSSLLFKM